MHSKEYNKGRAILIAKAEKTLIESGYGKAGEAHEAASISVEACGAPALLVACEELKDLVSFFLERENYDHSRPCDCDSCKKLYKAEAAIAGGKII